MKHRKLIVTIAVALLASPARSQAQTHQAQFSLSYRGDVENNERCEILPGDPVSWTIRIDMQNTTDNRGLAMFSADLVQREDNPSEPTTGNPFFDLRAANVVPQGHPCAPTQDCVDGACVPQCTDERPCGAGQFCFGGGCFNRCDGEECLPGHTCVDDVCLGCENVLCPPDQQCVAGLCIDPCFVDETGPHFCDFTQVCATGACVNPCDGVTCDDDEACVMGDCKPLCERMTNFSTPDGFSNPGQSTGLTTGYIGWEIDPDPDNGSGTDVIQIGGSQNTTRVAGSGMGETTSVRVGVGQSTQIVAQGTFCAPTEPGTYVLELRNVEAKVLRNTPPPSGPWPLDVAVIVPFEQMQMSFSVVAAESCLKGDFSNDDVCELPAFDDAGNIILDAPQSADTLGFITAFQNVLSNPKPCKGDFDGDCEINIADIFCLVEALSDENCENSCTLTRFCRCHQCVIGPGHGGPGDCNENGIADAIDIGLSTSMDCNTNFLPDECEIDANSSAPGGPFFCSTGCALDINNNGVPDECDPDCNTNAVPDDYEISEGSSADCNSNGIPDQCDSQVDCNSNQIQDACELAAGTAADCNSNHIPDDCESAADCNANQVQDICDIAAGTSIDCDHNGVIDLCEFTSAEDCNENETYDYCEETLTYEQTSDNLSPIGFLHNQTHTFTRLPPALGDVTLTFRASADLKLEHFPIPQMIAVRINGASVGGVFRSGADTCPVGPNQAALVITKETFNGLLINGRARIDMLASMTVDPFRCGENPSYIQVSIKYNYSNECNSNGVLDDCDIAGVTSEDCNSNGVPDECEAQTDCNDNAIQDLCELANGSALDCNSNGIPDTCDISPGSSLDCNSNLVPDECEEDCNTNGVADACDISGPTSVDCNSNAIPDECEPDKDCNSNQVQDICDIAGVTSEDCNTNGTPDECDVAFGTSHDCNSNGIPDECDISGTTSGDCDANGIPDECQVDCNSNGVSDKCDITGETSQDCNANLVPDECEPDCNGNGITDSCDLEVGTSGDCNENSVPDECDAEDGTSADCDSDGIPDECELHYDDFVAMSGQLSPIDAEHSQTFTLSDPPMAFSDVRLTFKANAGLFGGAYHIAVTVNDVFVGTAFLNRGYDCPEISMDQLLVPAALYNEAVNGGDAEIVLDASSSMISPCTPDSYVVVIVTYAPAGDCNSNGIPDNCDLIGGTSQDCNTNAVPDECESDCNGNGQPDECDIDGATSLDCNSNGVPDDCELSGVFSDNSGILSQIHSDQSQMYLVQDAPIARGEVVLTLDASADLDAATEYLTVFLNGHDLGDFYGFGANQCPVHPNRRQISISGDIFNAYVGGEDAYFDIVASLDVGADVCDVSYVVASLCYERRGDCNSNGMVDGCDITDATSQDCNGNRIPDECEPDCNTNEVPDDCDVMELESFDCNTNLIPDECEGDCNDNGTPDDCDIIDGTSLDCNTNGIPDECEADCNGNGIPDNCDIASGTSADCNSNRVPDSCDLACPVITFGKIVGTESAIPEGSGNFTWLSEGPAISDGMVVFYGTGVDGQQGIYVWADAVLERVADKNMEVPGDSENFTFFDTSPALSNGSLVFRGGNAGSHGIYEGGDTLSVMADKSTLIPSGSGTFESFGAQGLDRDGDALVFLGAGDGDQSGVYGRIHGTLVRLADRSVEIPSGGASTFEDFAVAPSISGTEVVFGGSNLAGDEGIYRYAGGDLSAVADHNTLIPGGTGNFTGFGALSMVDGTVVFIGEGSGDQIGIYSVRDNEIMALADASTPIPGGADNFDSMEDVALSGSIIAFTGSDFGSQERGIYASVDGGLCKIIDLSDSLDAGKTIERFDFSSSSLEDNALVFRAEYTDGSKGLYWAEIVLSTSRDCNDNDVPDECDIGQGTSLDCNSNLVPDECEPDADCNENAVQDICDIAGMTSEDCNGNGVPDECEDDCNTNGVADSCDLMFGASNDCNHNQVPDECDIAATASADCNSNGIPDECEVDCNWNGVWDVCDLSEGTSQDCNANQILDECELISGSAMDCNSNQVPDECEPDCNNNGVADPCDVAGETSSDCNSNNVPDECEDCNYNGFADACDLVQGTSLDCNSSGEPDDCELTGHFRREFAELHPVLYPATLAFAITEPRPALSDVSIEFFALADLDLEAEYISLFLNGTDIGEVFQEGAGQCGSSADPDYAALTLPAYLYNDLIKGMDAEFQLEPSALVNYECIGGSFVSVVIEYEPSIDCNVNGVPDDCDIAASTSLDCNDDRIPDECQLDCNSNAVPDDCDITMGTSEDCQPNGIPDECEGDCNANGSPDTCDITAGTSLDCNGNGTPDECDMAGLTSDDCNSNAVPDECDIAGDTSEDCNSNGIPDECDIAGPTTGDCNSNGVPDECDLAGFTAADCNSNDVPDECDWEVVVEDVMYAVQQQGYSGPDANLYLIDPSDATRSVIGNMNSGAADWITRGMGLAANPLTGQLFAIVQTTTQSSHARLATVNRYDGTASLIDGVWTRNNFQQHITDLAFRDNGTLFGVTGGHMAVSTSSSGRLVTIDLESAATTLFGLNAASTGRGQAIAFDSGTGLMFHGFDERVESINLVSHVRKTINLNPGFNDLTGMTFHPGTGVLFGCRGDLRRIRTHESGSVNIGDLDGEMGGLAVVYVVEGSPDCNTDGVPDECQSQTDSDSDGVLDICDLCDNFDDHIDCNTNGVPDKCDISDGTSLDCNSNSVPDECDIAMLSSDDCNDNGVPDECDVAGATSTDFNNNDVPDECEFDCDAWQLQKLAAGDAASGDQFGWSVDMDSDVAVVGSPFDDGNGHGSDSGSVLVYRYGVDGWVQEGGKLTAPDGASGDEFGHSVAVSGDVIVVGAYRADNGGSDRGAAYVFRYTNGSWDHEQTLFAESSENWDEFGNAVDISGDVIVVGAHRDGGSNRGAAYAFRYSSGSWGQRTKLGDNESENGDWFGTAVAADGDVIAVTAPFNDYAESNTGAVFVYRYYSGNPGYWGSADALTVSDVREGNSLGTAVSLSDSVLIVGQDNDDDAALNAGAAYVFRYDDGEWIEEDKLLASDAENGDGFGMSIAVDGDLAVIGAPSRDIAPYEDAGSAYVYRFTGVFWSEMAKMVPSDPANQDSFAQAVAVSGSRALVGAPREDEFGSESGAAYAYFGLDDCNTDEVLDICDIDMDTSDDCQGNGIPDECEPDCNTNGVPDDCDIAGPTSIDCDTNSVPDECDPDCNENAIADACDIAEATSYDCNTSGVPDECEADCNSNGLHDSCDIAGPTSEDCNSNNVPDECDLTGPTSADCNSNDVPDECDVVQTVTADDLYAVMQQGFSGPDANLYLVDPMDASIAVVGNMNGGPVNWIARGLGLAAQPATYQLFAVVQSTTAWSQSRRYLVTVNRYSGAATMVGTIGTGEEYQNHVTDLAFRSDGELLGVSGGFTFVNTASTGRLLRIDTSTGASSLIGLNTGNGRSQAIAIDSRTDLLFHGFVGTPGTVETIETVNLSSGVRTTINLNPGLTDFGSLTINPDTGYLFGAGWELRRVRTHEPGSIQIGEFDGKVGGLEALFVVEGNSDCDTDGVPDECEDDADSDGVIDDCDLCPGGDDRIDCNTNGYPDACDSGDTSPDCNTNDVPDECDIIGDTSDDCNDNGVPDDCDVANEYSEDVNTNGVPDECEFDCDPDELQKLTAQFSPANGDHYAWSLDLDGDVAVVGVPYDDDLGDSSGSAYVYRYGPTGWTYEIKLTGSGGANSDEFGRSVAVDGDVIVVGAHRVDYGGGWNRGAAYVYRYNNGAWSSDGPRLTAGDPENDAEFGISVDVNGDVIVVGAHREDLGGNNRGAAYVFRYTGGSWSQEAKLTDSEGENTDFFGTAVTVDGDVVAVTAPQSDYAESNAGAVLVYRYVEVEEDEWQWVYEATVTPSDLQPNKPIGYALDLSGDVLLVASENDDDAANSAGAAYVFRYDDEIWEEEDKLTASDAEAGDNFGVSVAVDGNIAVIGASNVDLPGYSDSGAAYVYRFTGGFWSEMAKLIPSDPANNDSFALSVAISGSRVLAGAPREDQYGSESGAAYAYFGLDDCNTDEVLDICDIDMLTSADCLPDGVPDECQTDCNTNYIPDVCEIAGGTTSDCDSNGVPDECDPDCNNNGIADGCDIAGPTSADCNTNSVPDECDIAGPTSSDCNTNDIPDECDLTLADIDALYAIKQQGPGGVDTNLYLVDPSNASKTVIGNMNAGPSPAGSITRGIALAAQPSTHQLFAIVQTSSVSTNVDNKLLATVNRTIGTATLIASIGSGASAGNFKNHVADLAFRSNSTLNGITGGKNKIGLPYTGRVVTIDTSTAVSTLAGINAGTGDGQSIATHPDINLMYHTFGSALETINVANGSLNTINSDMSYSGFIGLTYHFGLPKLLGCRQNLREIHTESTGSLNIGNMGVDMGGLETIYATTSPDCNTNAVPDECDIADETSEDVDPANGVPDECE